MKDTRTALKGLLLQYLMNIGLDWYLIFGKGISHACFQV